MENNCVENYLKKDEVALLDGSETEEESCRIQNDFLFEFGRTEASRLAVITGFGITIPRRPQDFVRASMSIVLRQGLLRIEERAACAAAFAYISDSGDFGTNYTDNMICAVSGIAGRLIDACQGDSGAPLVREVYDPDTEESCWVDVGITSWGYGCGQAYIHEGLDKHLPGYYTNLIRMMPWIKRKLGNASGVP